MYKDGRKKMRKCFCLLVIVIIILSMHRPIIQASADTEIGNSEPVTTEATKEKLPEKLPEKNQRNTAGEDKANNRNIESTSNIKKSLLKEDADEGITAKAVSQLVPLGFRYADLDLKTFVKEVKDSSGNEISSNDYTVTFVKSTNINRLELNDINNTGVTTVLVTQLSAEKTITVNVPTRVVWGEAISVGGIKVSGTTDDQYPFRTGIAYTLNQHDGKKYLISNYGNTHNTQNINVHRSFSSTYSTFTQYKVTENTDQLLSTYNKYAYSFNGTMLVETIVPRFANNTGELEVESGDVISLWSVENGSKNKKWNTRKIGSPTTLSPELGYFQNLNLKTVYYQIVDNKIEYLQYNNLKALSITAEQYDSQTKVNELAKNINTGLSNVKVKKVLTYPSTNTAGTKTGKVLVSETLVNGKEANFEVALTVNVKKIGIENPLSPNPNSPLTPIDSNSSLDNILGITYISNFHFGTQKITASDKIYNAALDQLKDFSGKVIETPGFLQIVDKRENQNGWKLQATQVSPFTNSGHKLEGTEISLENPVFNTSGTGKQPSTIEKIKLTPGIASEIAVANTGEGKGIWSLRFGNTLAQAKESISLQIPGTSPKEPGTYNTQIQWSLVDAP